MQENNQTNNPPDTPTGTPVGAVDSTVVITPDLSDNNPTTEAPAVVEATITEDVTPAPVSEVVTETETTLAMEPVAKKEFLAKSVLTQYGIATLIILVMGAGLVYALEQQGRINTGVFAKISSLVNPAPAAAKVNGVKITLADYEKNLAQLKNAAVAQGTDVENESIQSEIKKQAIDVLVNTELLRQEATKGGAVVTKDDIEKRYQEIVTSLGGAEALATKMAELGITEPSLRKDIEGEILIQGYLAKAIDTTKITITEEEITAGYALIGGGKAGSELPPLAEIKPQLEQQLKFNKEQELVNAHITTLREAAEIEVLI